ncbi:MAG: amidohydrolase family protein [Chloroflexota bacterium]
MTVRKEWLGLTMESPLEPEMPICDAHHHLWDRPDDRYLLEDLLEDIGGGHNIVGTVFIECRARYRTDGPEAMRPLGEMEFVRDTVAEAKRRGRPGVAAGIIGHVDLNLGDAAAEVLEAHLALNPDRFRGIRHITAWDDSPNIHLPFPAHKGMMLEPAFRAGFACLQRYGLSFDSWLYHPQLPELGDLARAFPETTIICDHVGGTLLVGPYADRREEALGAWRRSMSELAECPNVVVKLGGIGMMIYGFDWPKQPAPPDSASLAQDMAPFYLWCLEKFGVERCIFESNFPVDKRSYSYTVLWNAFKRLSADFSPAERRALFHDNAVRVYRLKDNA